MEKTYRYLFITIFGALGSIIIGNLISQNSIFNIKSPAFQFVAFGIFGSFFFALIEYETLKNQLLGAIVLLVENVVLFSDKNISFILLLRDVFYLGSLFLSLKFYKYFIDSNLRIPYYVRSFTLAVIFGILNTITISLLFLLNTKGGLPHLGFIYFIAKNALFIGLGIGLGLDFYFQNNVKLFKLIGIK